MSKVAVVTGASKGIGRACAIRLAQDGYTVVVNYSSSDAAAEEVVNTIKAEGGEAVAYKADVSDLDAVKKMFREIGKQFGQIDVLVNNAGISHFGLITDMTPKEWRNIMSINLDSVFYTSKHATKLMLKEHRGHIINISSVWGNVGASLETAYSASKGAVNSFTKAMAKELAPSGIAVNAIACGIIDTDMNGHLSPDELQAVVDEIPADRMGTPDEIGQMVLSIIDAPSYMTGQIITVDGGWT